MPVRVVFRCELCAARPDPETQRTLEAQLQELLFGQYLDAPPGRWLTWHGAGIYGARRYACARHRGELTAMLREHYGTIGPHPWAMGPYRTRAISPDTARARAKLGGATAGRWGWPA